MIQRARTAMDWIAAAWSVVDVYINLYNFKTERYESNSNAALNMVLWLPYAAEFLPFALACRLLKEDFFGSLQEQIDAWASFANSAAGCHFGPRACFLCEKPLSLCVDANDRISNRSGPAIQWSDGLDIYAWRGMIVDRVWIESPNAISIAQINAERNVERRRVMVELFGESNYLSQQGAEVIDHDDCYGTLYRLKFQGDEPLVMVKVLNATTERDGTYKSYFLRVPPGITRARQAVAWTFGLSEDEYCPNIES